MYNKKFVVVGGGTAGWLTALVVQKMVKNSFVTLVESDDIGILGAGEGTVPYLISILSYLNIPIMDVLYESDGSIKLGIEFSNWNGDNTSYFHPFGNPKTQNSNFEKGIYFNFIKNDIPVQNYSLQYKLFLNNKSNFILDSNTKEFISKGGYALHFNARKLAKFLREIAEKRGIKRIEGIVEKINNNETDNVDNIILKGGTKIEGDFFFDCSGFNRLITGKHYNSEWISYKDVLPLDTALPFFISHNNKNIKPVTEAIAMKYGWVWKIPVKDRYGCGYVFDSSYIDNDDAKKELEEYFQVPIESPKTFKFNAGCYKNIWIKNTLAIGLSSGFIEPLEATSIWINCLNLFSFLHNNLHEIDDDEIREKYNHVCFKRNDIVKEFIHLHYFGERSDSVFWINFQNKHSPSNYLRQKIHFSKKIGLTWDNDIFENSDLHIASKLFPTESWLMVMDGLKMIDKKPYDFLQNEFLVKNEIFHEEFVFQRELIEKCISNDDFCRFVWKIDQ
jgi:tryptophan 7-halogenase